MVSIGRRPALHEATNPLLLRLTKGGETPRGQGRSLLEKSALFFN